MTRWLLHCALATLALAMHLASRVSSRFRAALSRDRVVAIVTKDGAAYHFAVSNRRLAGRRGSPERADFTLRFTTSAQALWCLLSPASVGRILNGILDGTIEHEGSLVLLVWFDGRVQQVAPLREPIRRRARFPGAYVNARQDVAAAAMMTREPVQDALAPDWAAAWRQREKLLLIRVAAGAPHPEF